MTLTRPTRTAPGGTGVAASRHPSCFDPEDNWPIDRNVVHRKMPKTAALAFIVSEPYPSEFGVTVPLYVQGYGRFDAVYYECECYREMYGAFGGDESRWVWRGIVVLPVMGHLQVRCILPRVA